MAISSKRVFVSPQACRFRFDGHEFPALLRVRRRRSRRARLLQPSAGTTAGCAGAALYGLSVPA
jgi:hypothetical protein